MKTIKTIQNKVCEELGGIWATVKNMYYEPRTKRFMYIGKVCQPYGDGRCTIIFYAYFKNYNNKEQIIELNSYDEANKCLNTYVSID